MIEMYTGFVGSGKSYHATHEALIIAESRTKKEVIANFPIKKKVKKLRSKINKMLKRDYPVYKDIRWTYWDNDELSPLKLIEKSFAYKAKHGDLPPEGHYLLIIDEAGIVFNSRDWNVKPDERKNWIKFFTQSRKLGYDIILIVQDNRMLDRQIRSLVEYEVQHKKMNNWTLFKFLPVTMFLSVKFWNGVRGIRGNMSITRYKKSVADRYDTQSLFGYGDELKIDDII